MPNLENLKKQAKLYLRWHRDGYYPVAAQIRALLPRFEHLSDQAILEQAFRLADTQELIARKHGFEDWQALLKGIESMHTEPADRLSKPTLLAAEPQLFTTNITAACEYYSSKLGFRIAFSYGEPPFYAQVVRDGAALNLRHLDEPAIRPELQGKEQLLSASITVDDIKPLYLEFQAAGASFHQPLKTEPWGARTFIISDPDGNLILFAGQA